MNMVYNKSTATVLILDNSTTAMTGAQDNPATGKTLQGDISYSIDFSAICKALGIEDVKVVDAFDIKELENVVKAARNSEQLSVIISKAPCAVR